MDKYIIPLIALIVGALLKPAGEYLLAIIIFKFDHLRHRRVSGQWKSTWAFSDPDRSESNEEVVTLHQFGSFIRGTGIGGKHNYCISAKLNPDGYLHGTWREIRPGVDWYGSLKLLVANDDQSMRGKWIRKCTGGVRAGDWKFERIP